MTQFHVWPIVDYRAWGSGADPGSWQSACRGDVGHKPGSRLPLLSGRPAVTLANLKRAAAKKCTLLQIRLSVVVTGINYFYATCRCSFDRDYNSYDIYIFLIMCGIRKKVD